MRLGSPLHSAPVPRVDNEDVGHHTVHGVLGEVHVGVDGVYRAHHQPLAVLRVGAERIVVYAVRPAVVLVGMSAFRPAHLTGHVHGDDVHLPVRDLTVVVLQRAVGRVSGIGGVFRRVVRRPEEQVVEVAEVEPGLRSTRRGVLELHEEDQDPLSLGGHKRRYGVALGIELLALVGRVGEGVFELPPLVTP